MEADIDHDAKIAEYIAKPPLRILGDRVLVYQKPHQERLSSGLFLPRGHIMGFEDRATVLTIAEDAKAPDGSPMCDVLKPGDQIIFKRQPNSAIHPDDREGTAKVWENLLRLDTENVLAVVE